MSFDDASRTLPGEPAHPVSAGGEPGRPPARGPAARSGERSSEPTVAIDPSDITPPPGNSLLHEVDQIAAVLSDIYTAMGRGKDSTTHTGVVVDTAHLDGLPRPATNAALERLPAPPSAAAPAAAAARANVDGLEQRLRQLELEVQEKTALIKRLEGDATSEYQRLLGANQRLEQRLAEVESVQGEADSTTRLLRRALVANASLEDALVQARAGRTGAIDAALERHGSGALVRRIPNPRDGSTRFAPSLQIAPGAAAPDGSGAHILVATGDVARMEPGPATVAAPPAAPPAKAWPRGRILRVAIAVALLVLALWSVVLPSVFPISSQAVVNARIATVRAPIEGYLTPFAHDLGEAVHADEVLSVVRNEHADASRLESMRAGRQALQVRTDALASEIATREREAEDYRGQLENYRNRLLADQRALRIETASRLDSLRAAAATRARDVGRIESLPPGTLAANLVDDARQEQLAAAKAVEAQEALLTRSDNQLAALAAGIYLGIDSPLEKVRLDAVTTRLADLRIQSAEAARNLAADDDDLAVEEAHLAHRREAKVVAPAAGVVWKRSATVGQFVTTGADLYQIADRDTIVVEVWLHQRYLESVTVGDAALIYLVGDARQIRGTVTAVRISDNGAHDESYAYHLPSADQEQKSFKVVVAIDARDRQAALIGQRAKILLTEQNPGYLKRALLWLYAVVEF